MILRLSYCGCFVVSSHHLYQTAAQISHIDIAFQEFWLYNNIIDYILRQLSSKSAEKNKSYTVAKEDLYIWTPNLYGRKSSTSE